MYEKGKKNSQLTKADYSGADIKISKTKCSLISIAVPPCFFNYFYVGCNSELQIRARATGPKTRFQGIPTGTIF